MTRISREELLVKASTAAIDDNNVSQSDSIQGTIDSYKQTEAATNKNEEILVMLPTY